MTNYFILYETDFDYNLLKKYHGDDLSAGVYAVPEEDPNVDPNIDQQTNDLPDMKKEGEEKLAKSGIADPNPPDPLNGLSQDQIQAFQDEILPLKKITLITKLTSLSQILKNHMMYDSNLELLLKFAGNLNYQTLYILALNILNSLKKKASELGGQQQENNNE